MSHAFFYFTFFLRGACLENQNGSCIMHNLRSFLKGMKRLLDLQEGFRGEHQCSCPRCEHSQNTCKSPSSLIVLHEGYKTSLAGCAFFAHLWRRPSYEVVFHESLELQDGHFSLLPSVTPLSFLRAEFRDTRILLPHILLLFSLLGKHRARA